MSTDPEKRREYNRRYRERHPDRVQDARKKWLDKHPDFYKKREQVRRERDPEAYSARHFKSRYGIALSDYNALVVKQDGRCAICGGPPTRNNRLYVDHDHVTGRVRGLLCWEDNLILGQVRDSPARLRSAAAYLEKGQ